MANDVEVKIGGSTSEVESSMQRTTKVVQDAMARIRENFAQTKAMLSGGFDKIKTEGLAKANKAIEDLKQSAGGVIGSLTSLKGIIAQVGLAMLAKEAIGVMSSFEQLEIRLRSVMGSASKAQDAFAWINQFAKDTPFEVTQVTNAFMLLKNMGLDPMDGTLKAISDQSAKTGGGFQTLERISLALGQAWTKGKLQGEEAMQLLEAGVPVWDMLAKVTGKTTAEVQKLSEKGQLGRDAIKALIAEIGRSADGAAVAQMESLNGQWSNFIDNVNGALNTLREAGGLDTLKAGLRSVNAYLEEISSNGKLNHWAEQLGTLFGIIGDTISALGDVIGDVFSIIIELWDGLTGNVERDSESQINALDVLSVAVEMIRVAFIGLSTGIRLVMEMIRQVVQGTVSIVISIFVWLRGSVEETFEAISLAIKVVITTISTFAEVARRALKLDFSGAKAAWQAGLSDIENQVKASANRILAINDETNAKLEAARAPESRLAEIAQDGHDRMYRQRQYADDSGNQKPAKAASTASSTSGKVDLLAGSGGDESRVRQWEAQLSKLKASTDAFHEYSLQDEVDYWKKILDTQNLTAKERASVEKKYYDGKASLQKKEFEEHIAGLKTQLDSYKNNQDKRLEIATQMAKDIGAKYGTESKEYQAVQQQIIQIQRQKKQQIQQIEDEIASARKTQRLAEVDDAEALAQLDVALGKKTNDELLEDQRQFEAQRYEIALDGVNRKLALLDAQGSDKDVVEYQKTLSEKAALDQQYATKKRALDLKTAQESMKDWNSFQSSLASTYASGMQALLKRTLSFKDALKGLFQEIGKAFITEIIIKPLAQKAAAQTKELAMTAATKAKELAIEAAAKAKEWALATASKAKEMALDVASYAKKLAVKLGFLGQETAATTTAKTTETTAAVTAATTQVAADGIAAGAGAAKSQAGIPIVGPALALGAMAAVMASVLALKGKIKSASGGYSIPRGTNPITQLHEEEMVLPKAESSVIRDLAAGKIGGRGTNGADGSDGGKSGDVHYHDYSGKLSRDQIRQNAKIIAEELSRVTKRGYSPA